MKAAPVIIAALALCGCDVKLQIKVSNDTNAPTRVDPSDKGWINISPGVYQYRPEVNDDGKVNGCTRLRFVTTNTVLIGTNTTPVEWDWKNPPRGEFWIESVMTIPEFKERIRTNSVNGEFHTE